MLSLVQRLSLWLDAYENYQREERASQVKFQKHILNIRKNQLRRTKLRLRNRLCGNSEEIEYKDVFSMKGNIGKRRNEVREVMSREASLAKDFETERGGILN